MSKKEIETTAKINSFLGVNLTELEKINKTSLLAKYSEVHSITISKQSENSYTVNINIPFGSNGSKNGKGCKRIVSTPEKILLAIDEIIKTRFEVNSMTNIRYVKGLELVPKNEQIELIK